MICAIRVYICFFLHGEALSGGWGGGVDMKYIAVQRDGDLDKRLSASTLASLLMMFSQCAASHLVLGH